MSKVLKRQSGVLSATASFIRGTAKVTYDPRLVTPSQLVQAINQQTFYRASLPSERLRNVVLKIEGMKDRDTARQVASALRKLEGMEGGSLDIKNEEAQLEFDPAKLTAEEIIASVRSGTPLRVSVASVPSKRSVVDNSDTPLREEPGWLGNLWRRIINFF